MGALVASAGPSFGSVEMMDTRVNAVATRTGSDRTACATLDPADATRTPATARKRGKTAT